jgi:hypothetical protein
MEPNRDAHLATEDARPAPDPTLTARDVLAAAEDLVPLLRERAVAADRDRRIDPDTYRRLEDAGFFHILKPKKYGGLELSEHEHARVAMTLARGCASTAWVFSILSSDNIAILAYPEQVQDEIWGTNSYPIPGASRLPGQAGHRAGLPPRHAQLAPGGCPLPGRGDGGRRALLKNSRPSGQKAGVRRTSFRTKTPCGPVFAADR